MSISPTPESEVGAASTATTGGQQASRLRAEGGHKATIFLVAIEHAGAQGFMPARYEVSVAAEHGAESTTSADFTALAGVGGGSEPIAGGLPPSPLASTAKSSAIAGLGMRAAPSVIS